MDESELRDLLDATLGGAYEVQMVHSTSEKLRPVGTVEDAVEVDHETEIQVQVHSEDPSTAQSDLRKLPEKVDGLHLQAMETEERLFGEVRTTGYFVLLEREMTWTGSGPSLSTEPASLGGGESAEQGAEDEEDSSPREGQIDVATAHEATLRLYSEDDTKHVLRKQTGGGACGHDHAGTAVADIKERYESLRDFLEDDDLCRECGAILVHQFNMPPGRVPGHLRRWADG